MPWISNVKPPAYEEVIIRVQIQGEVSQRVARVNHLGVWQKACFVSDTTSADRWQYCFKDSDVVSWFKIEENE